ncbi:MAG: hypothetical protein CSA94_01555 [Bacteroidetes bacterium]|nr:MAG: hypothetical protein CSA94_01555 [Bacteroidota bacterium]
MAFGSKNKIKKELAKGIEPCGTITMLSAGTVLDGSLKLGGDLRVDGVINGDVQGKKKVVIGEKGKVIGDIYCEFLELHGRVEGDVKCKQVARLHATAFLRGDLYASQFSVAMGASFIGASKGEQKELNLDNVKTNDTSSKK